MVSKAKLFNKCIIYQEPYIKYDHPLTQIFAQHRDEQFKMLNSNRGQCFVCIHRLQTVHINTFITLPVGAERGGENGFTVRVGFNG